MFLAHCMVRKWGNPHFNKTKSMIVYPKTSFANAKAKQSKSSTISSIFWLYLMLRVILIGQAGKLTTLSETYYD